MDIDLIIKIAVPLTAAVIGAYCKLIFERKARLIVFYGHASSFTVRSTPPIEVYTHSVTIRNTGKIPVTNIRVGHATLPENYKIYPPHQHTVIDEGGIREILISQLVPGEEIAISYLYFPPLTYQNVNSAVKHDGGFAKAINVLPTYVPTKNQKRIAAILIYLGIILGAYIAYDVGAFLYKAYTVVENYHPVQPTPQKQP